jgi:hypothetical protein
VTRRRLVETATALLLCACPKHDGPTHEATVYFRGEPVAHVADVVDGSHIERKERLERTGEIVLTTAELDAHGLAVTARYSRGAARSIAIESGALVDGSGARVTLDKPALVVDLLRYAQPQKPVDVDLVDLSSADFIPGKLERRGAEVVALDAHGAVVARANVEGVRTGPGAFHEGDAPAAIDRAAV